MNKNLVLNLIWRQRQCYNLSNHQKHLASEATQKNSLKNEKKFFKLTQTAEEHRGIFSKAFLSVEATKKYEGGESMAII